MKIVFVLDQLGHGGIATTYLRWAEELLKHGYQVAIFCQKQGGQHTAQVPPGVELHINNSWRAVLASGSLYRYLHRQPRDTVLVAGGFTLVYVQALRPAWMKLWAYTPSSPGLGILLPSTHPRWLHFALYFLMRRATRNADMVSAVSNGTARNVEAWAALPAGSVRTLYNPACTGVFLDAHNLPTPHPWLADSKLKTFCSFGRLEVTKNYLHLLKAFRQVHSAHPHTRLLIGGSGSLQGELEAYIRSNFTSPCPVELLGNVPNPQAYMAHAAAYVSSSRLEAFGNVLVEALATGTQVVATDAPFGPAEILNKPEYGTLVQMSDAPALAAAMEQVLKIPAAKNRAARVARARQFSAPALWPEFEAVLNAISGAPSRVVVVQRVVAAYRKPLFEALAERYGWQVAAASNFPNPKSLRAVQQAPWLRTFPFLFFKNPYRCWVPLGRIVRELKPDTLVLEAGTTMSSTWLTLLCWPLLRRLGLYRPKVVLWGHGAPVAFGATPLRAWLFTNLRRWMLNRADGYLTYTQPEAAYLQTLAPNAHIGFTNNSIDITPMLALRSKAYAKTKALHILMVGRITPDKRFAEAIAAMPQVWKHIPQAELTIVGGGEALEGLRKLAGKELGKRIHLPGAVYEEKELAVYYNRSQLFWLMGAAGLGVNHALAYGLPVLAYAPNLPGGPRHHPEIYYVEEGVTGWLVGNTSMQAMVDRMVQLLTAKQGPRAQLGSKLSEYAAANLTLEHTAKAMLQFIKTIDK